MFLYFRLSPVKEARRDEVLRIVEAINTSRVEYASALCSWLREVLPRQVSLDEVILCGGTAEYMRGELENHFDYTEVSWNGGIEIPQQLKDDELGSRLCDAYGMYSAFKGAIVSSLSGAVSNG